MGSVLENSYFGLRLRQLEETYPEPRTFADCDCRSYSYFTFSLVLFLIGSFITFLALGGVDFHVFSYYILHKWLLGPLFICFGTLFAVKSVLYLRRKSMVQMLLRQRALLRGMQELAEQTQQAGRSARNPSNITLPPAYELLVTEEPPPTYEEAGFLMRDEKHVQPTARGPESSSEKSGD